MLIVTNENGTGRIVSEAALVDAIVAELLEYFSPSWPGEDCARLSECEARQLTFDAVQNALRGRPRE